MRTIGKILLPLVVLALAGVAAGGLVNSAPEPPSTEPQERIVNIAAAPVSIGAATPMLRLYGRLVSGRSVDLRALVAGEVVSVSEQLREGGLLLRGEEILRIDDFAYQSALREARASLAEARARLWEYQATLRQEEDALQRELEQLELTRIDQERAEELAERGTISRKSLDDKRLATLARELSTDNRRNNIAVRKARIAQQEAVIERLDSGVSRAGRALEDSVLTAPFDGLVEEVGVAAGRLIGVNDRVATLIDLGNLEARFTLSNAQYGRLIAADVPLMGREMEVIWRAGAEVTRWSGRIARAAPRISAGSGGVDIYVALDIDNVNTPMRPGAFLEADFPDITYENVVRLPQTALYEGDTVYVVGEEERLQPRAVDVVGEEGQDVLLRGGLRAGDVALVSRLPQVGAGIRVRVVAP